MGPAGYSRGCWSLARTVKTIQGCTFGVVQPWRTNCSRGGRCMMAALRRETTHAGASTANIASDKSHPFRQGLTLSRRAPGRQPLCRPRPTTSCTTRWHACGRIRKAQFKTHLAKGTAAKPNAGHADELARFAHNVRVQYSNLTSQSVQIHRRRGCESQWSWMRPAGAVKLDLAEPSLVTVAIRFFQSHYSWAAIGPGTEHGNPAVS